MNTINDLKKVLKKSTPEGINGARKSLYQRLCGDKYCYYNDIVLFFDFVNYKTPELLTMNIGIPIDKLGIDSRDLCGVETYVEDYFFREVAAVIQLFERDNVIEDSQKEYVQAKLYIQECDSRIVKRTCSYVQDDYVYVKCHCKMPLNGLNAVAGKKALRMITDLLKELDQWMENFNLNPYEEGRKVYVNQLKIRDILKEKKAVCFIRDGSILPRDSEGKIEENATPFYSPEEMREVLKLSENETVTGMLIKQGITAVTGGAYSGKTTLLEAIQSGIYNHVSGDGREYVITDESAVKVCAEDGRPVNNLDISPFFQEEVNGSSLQQFSAQHTSGSTSQAVNIIEALYAESKVLLVDEDRSAANFMHRDEVMRDIIEREPIIPFTDRIKEISTRMGVSLILVIGGTSQYFGYADSVILMDHFKASDITEKIKKFEFADTSKPTLADWTYFRKIVTKFDKEILFQGVCTKDRSAVFFDDYVSELTNTGNPFSQAQLNLLAKVAGKVLEIEDRGDLKEDVDRILSQAGHGESFRQGDFEQIRRVDVLMCLFRMSGLEFAKAQ